MHRFPPLTPIPLDEKVVLGLFFLALVLAIAGLVFLPRRPVFRWEWVFWAVLPIGLLIALQYQQTDLTILAPWRPFLGLSVLVVGWIAPPTVLLAGARRRAWSWTTAICAGGVSGLLFVTMLLPRLVHSREVSRLSTCKNNLKQLGYAFYNYESKFREFPSPTFAGEGEPPRTWRVELLPLFSEHGLRSRYDNGSAWNAVVNGPVATTSVPFYHCPSNRRPQDVEGRFYSDYLLPSGQGALFEGQAVGAAIREITDGMSNTIMIVESCGRQVVWTQPRDVDVGEARIDVNGPGPAEGTSSSLLSSYHPAGGGMAYAAFADGAVREISPRTTPEVLKALLSPRGDESVDIPSSW